MKAAKQEQSPDRGYDHGAAMSLDPMQRELAVVRIEQWCRICDTLALIQEDPTEEDTYVIEGCECIGPFRAQGLFWMAASQLRVEHREEFRCLAEYIRREGAAGNVPMITIGNWVGLAANQA